MQSFINNAFEIWSKIITGSRQRWRWTGYTFTLLAFLYLAALIIVSREQIQEFPWKLYWLPFLVSLAIYPIALLVQYTVWSRLISFHHSASWRDMAIYLRVLLIRRLPGGVWHWVDRTAIYTGTTEIPGRVVMLANFLEWSLLLLLAAALGVIGWQGGPPWLRGVLCVALLALATYLAYSWQPKQRAKIRRLAESILWLGLYLLSWIIGGVILYLYSATTQAGLAEDMIYQPVTLLQCVWTWAIAGGSSQLVVFIPGGLGIREIALTWMLKDVLPVASILLISILIRLTYAFADILWGSLGMALSLSVFKDRQAEKPVAGR
jgi:hypothetical protein